MKDPILSIRRGMGGRAAGDVVSGGTEISDNGWTSEAGN